MRLGAGDAILQQGDSDIFLLTKHLHHLPILQRADGENRLIKRKKRCHVLRLRLKRATPHRNANEPLCLCEMAFCLQHLKCPKSTLELPYESPLQTHGVKNTPAVWETVASSQFHFASKEKK